MDRAQRKAQVQAQLQARYRDIKRPEMRAVMRVQDEILSALRDHLRGIGFIEILAPIIGPATDPGIRGASQVSFDYYGTQFKVMSSMILYKQMAVNSFDRIFALSPNIRLEPIETIETGRHLSEFRQLDLEVARASYFDVMEIGEGMVTYVVKRVKANCSDELGVLGRELKTPKLPFKKITCRDAVELLREKGFEVKQGEEIPWNAEAELSRSFGDFFWLIDYPKTARGFYDREDEECPGILRDFDLFYPEGYGEAVSGGEREYKYERVVARMLSTGEVPETYRWYLEMLREGTTPSAGFGIGVERLTRYVCGRDYIWESVPFPRVPGVVSP
ncbi:MAG: asparagine synthetase A [Candidatus Bathyarchaeia archaeon]